MVNRLMHRVEVTDRHVVETVGQLADVIAEYNHGNMDLDATYVIELMYETLSDRSRVPYLHIRLAERVAG